MKNEINVDDFIPPKLCFDLWIETGKFTTIPYLLRNQGYVYKGKIASVAMCNRQATKYMITHAEEVRPIIDAELKKSGYQPMTDDEWNKYILRQASKYYQRQASFLAWIREYGYRYNSGDVSSSLREMQRSR